MDGIGYSDIVSTVMVLFLVLNFAFGRGDRNGKEIEAIKEKVHSLELSQRDREDDFRRHVGSEYATKDDFIRLEKVIESALSSIQQYTGAVTAMLGPIADQLGVQAVRE